MNQILCYIKVTVNTNSLYTFFPISQTHKFGLFSCGKTAMTKRLNSASKEIMTETNTKFTHFYESF